MADITGNKKGNHLIGTVDPDTIFGLGGNDILEGRSGTDLITGDGGNDVVEGGDDGDEMHGGDGTDTLRYAASDVGVIVYLGPAGEIALASGGHSSGDTATGFENITGSHFGDNLHGNDFVNVLRGGDGKDELIGFAGDDTLKAGKGEDGMRGGAGADMLDGGGGISDGVDYADSAAGVTITLGKDGAQTIGAGGDAEGDKIKNVEEIYASDYEDVLIGNNLANILEGIGGNDTIKGGGGDDRLFGYGGTDTVKGGSGNDELEGGSDDDTLNGGKGDDTFRFFTSFGNDVIKDFKEGDGPGDVIEFDNADFADFAAVQAASAQVGDDVVITKDASNTLTLENVLLANLNADDVAFF